MEIMPTLFPLKIVNKEMTSEDIKKLREILGLSQQQFAALVGSSIKTISNWETGGKIPAARISQLEALMASASAKPSTIQTATGSHATQISGDNAHIGGCASLDKAMAEIAAQRRLTEDALARLSKSQAQIDDLITILKSKLL